MLLLAVSALVTLPVAVVAGTAAPALAAVVPAPAAPGESGRASECYGQNPIVDQGGPYSIFSVDRNTSCRHRIINIVFVRRGTNDVVGTAAIEVLEIWDTEEQGPRITHIVDFHVLSSTGAYAPLTSIVVRSQCTAPYCTATNNTSGNIELVAGTRWTASWYETYDLFGHGHILFSNTRDAYDPTVVNAEQAGAGVKLTFLPPPDVADAPPAVTSDGPAAWRCDTVIASNTVTPGCVNQHAPGEVLFSTSQYPGIRPVAEHVRAAQAAGLPGAPGSAPLHRVTQAMRDANRRAVCEGSRPKPPAGQSCDEYPLAVSREGGNALTASTMDVPIGANNLQGTATNYWFNYSRIIVGDPFYVLTLISPTGGGSGGGTEPAQLKVMVVGDSISHGNEGDFTWRYRLYQHLRHQGVDTDFVGPNYGTDYVPGEVQTTSQPTRNGGYRPGIGFTDSQHFARWGWQMHQAKDDIQAAVTSYRPTVILLELGFNDLGWNVSSPVGLINDLKTFVARARAADPDVDFVIGNVPKRTYLDAFPDLNDVIQSYNDGLPPNLAALSTTRSTITMADLATATNPPAANTYDGLHPNVQGEAKIARAFAGGLQALGVAPAYAEAAPTEGDWTPAPPSSIAAVATGGGAHVSWSHSFGSRGYRFFQRDVTLGQGWQEGPIDVPADSWDVNQLVDGHTYEFKVRTTHGDYRSADSGVASVVAHPTTAPAPAPITVTPGSGSTTLSWARPTGAYSGSISGYNVYWSDTTAGGTVSLRTVSGTSTSVTGLVNGHRYAFAVASVNSSGEGLLGAANAAIPGGGTPAAPVVTQARMLSLAEVAVTWTSVAAGADYWVYYRQTGTANAWQSLPLGIYGTNTWNVGFLVGGADKYTFCVRATNGTLMSPQVDANCKVASTAAAAARSSSAAAGTAFGALAAGGAATPVVQVDPALLRGIRSRKAGVTAGAPTAMAP
jgi:lysophospholipase L1-like esterase